MVFVMLASGPSASRSATGKQVGVPAPRRIEGWIGKEREGGVLRRWMLERDFTAKGRLSQRMVNANPLFVHRYIFEKVPKSEKCSTSLIPDDEAEETILLTCFVILPFTCGLDESFTCNMEISLTRIAAQREQSLACAPISSRLWYQIFMWTSVGDCNTAARVGSIYAK